MSYFNERQRRLLETAAELATFYVRDDDSDMKGHVVEVGTRIRCPWLVVDNAAIRAPDTISIVGAELRAIFAAADDPTDPGRAEMLEILGIQEAA